MSAAVALFLMVLAGPVGDDHKLKVGVVRKVGIEVAYPIQCGRRECILSVEGPVVSKRAVGLGFRIRF